MVVLKESVGVALPFQVYTAQAPLRLLQPGDEFVGIPGSVRVLALLLVPDVIEVVFHGEIVYLSLQLRSLQQLQLHMSIALVSKYVFK